LNKAGRTRGAADWSDVLAGLIGGVFAPAATFVFGLPWWASLPGAVVVFLGVQQLARPRRLFEGFDFDEADRASLELAREVLSGAQAELKRLHDLALDIATLAVRQRLDHLHLIAEGVVREVEQRPRRANNVRRLLTYYLPAAVRLAHGYRLLERSNAPDRLRVAAIGEMIDRLDQLFGRHADRLSEEEVEGLDVELRLLENAIRDEQGR
jgi:5-bromo-4-chloroindolyl phosphate hydrolysis protein